MVMKLNIRSKETVHAPSTRNRRSLENSAAHARPSTANAGRLPGVSVVRSCFGPSMKSRLIIALP